MLKRLVYGPWEPDKPSNTTLRDARNVLPGSLGYLPVKAFGAITPALPSGFLGGRAYVGLDGTSALLAGTATNLYRYSGGAWSSVFAGSATAWRFAQFGDNVIATTGGAPVSFDLAGGSAAALAGSPPGSDLVATVRDFVVLAGDSANLQTVTWSGLNDSTEWTPGVNQSGSQILPDGGEVMGLAGGEYGLVIQKRAIKRMSYVGAPVVFQFDEIASNIGCMAKGSVAQAGRMVFFLAEQGFQVTDGNEVAPIGDEKFDRWFFARFARSDIEASLSAAIDPRAPIVYWAMPGSPGVILAYNWVLKQASYIETNVKAVFNGFTANVSLDALDALYPGGVDTIPLSLDDPSFEGGNPLLLAVDGSNAVGALSGDNLAATFVTPRTELEPGRRVRVRSLRPVSDAADGTVAADCRARDSDIQIQTFGSTLRDNGDFPIRANGRHISITHNIPAGAAWSFVSGIDLEYEPEGHR